jgi:hypothetical protein
MTSVLIRRALPTVFGILLLASSAAAQGVPRLDSYDGVAVPILQSNNAGNIHHIIDPTINKVVGLIRGCPHAHKGKNCKDSDWRWVENPMAGFFGDGEGYKYVNLIYANVE